MALVASFEAPENLDAILSEIQGISSNQVELTPRDNEVLKQLCLEGNLATLFLDRQLIGWALVEPLVKGLAEVGMVYVKPEFRSAEAFTELMKLIAHRPEKVILATYDPALIRYVKSVWKAKQTSLAKVIWLSRGKFLTKRLDKRSRQAIRSKVRKAKPLYAIVGER